MFKNKFICKDGTLKVGEVSGDPLIRDGKIIAVVSVARDITERKAFEEEKRIYENELRQAHKMESIGTLAGGIAHDFNNILAIIIGNTELALRKVFEGDSAHFNLKEIKTAGFRAKDIVSQLLSFSRKTDHKLQPVQIVPIIQDALKFLRSTIPTTVDIRQYILATDETILFVDDEKSVVIMAKQLLEELGYRVITASTAHDAMEQFNANPSQFDLVITDMAMPNMSGVKLSQKLKAIRPDIQIIICTGYSTLIDEERAKKLGLAAFVMKPIILEEIAKTIRRVLDESELISNA